jgi:hypothetical protein
VSTATGRGHGRWATEHIGMQPGGGAARVVQPASEKVVQNGRWCCERAVERSSKVVNHTFGVVTQAVLHLFGLILNTQPAIEQIKSQQMTDGQPLKPYIDSKYQNA